MKPYLKKPIYLILLSVVGIFLVFSFMYCSEIKSWVQCEDNRNIIMLGGTLATTLSVLIAAGSFQSNNVWRKKEKAMHVAYDVKDKLGRKPRDIAVTLGKIEKQGKHLPLIEILRLICVKNDDNTLKIFTPINNRVNNPSYEFDKNDRIIENSSGSVTKEAPFNLLKDILNEYEYLAAGIKKNVFDEDSVLNLLEGSFIECYNLFFYFIIYYNITSSRNEIEIDVLKKLEWEMKEDINDILNKAKNQLDMPNCSGGNFVELTEKIIQRKHNK
jgi:hypothetical protein